MRGQRFVLRDATVAIGIDEAGKRVAITIPAGAEITVSDIVPLEPPRTTLSKSMRIGRGDL
jgi:hypothetical protein